MDKGYPHKFVTLHIYSSDKTLKFFFKNYTAEARFSVAYIIKLGLPKLLQEVQFTGMLKNSCCANPLAGFRGKFKGSIINNLGQSAQ